MNLQSWKSPLPRNPLSKLCSWAFGSVLNSDAPLGRRVTIWPSRVLTESTVRYINGNPRSGIAAGYIALGITFARAYQHVEKLEHCNFNGQWSGDSDDVVRPCKVYLSIISGHGRIDEHWALMFDFERLVLTYEVTQENGCLVPNCQEDDLSMCELSKTRQEIAVIETSPSVVNKIAKGNLFNWQQCSKSPINGNIWVMQLAMELGIDILVFVHYIQMAAMETDIEAINEDVDFAIPLLYICISYHLDNENQEARQRYLGLSKKSNMLMKRMTAQSEIVRNHLDLIIMNVSQMFKYPPEFDNTIMKDLICSDDCKQMISGI